MSSQNRGILTTHVGSLPRPSALLTLLKARRDGGVDEEEFDAVARSAVAECVTKQVDAGVDVVNDGEMSKPSYVTYCTQRYEGFGMRQGKAPRRGSPEFRDYREAAQSLPKAKMWQWNCIGELHQKDDKLLNADLNNFASALRCVAGGDRPPVDSFMTAASPGVMSLFIDNQYYPTHRAYIEALSGIMQTEYEAIHRAGHILQIDCPDLAMGHNVKWANMPLQEFREQCELHIAALNHATRNIPPERMRMHVCWGNYPGPHHLDIELREIATQVFAARPKYLLVETANPRHSHEVDDFRSIFRLPEDKILIPGVVDTKTNYIEHPRLVAKRLREWVEVIGKPERVIGAPDCGFGTFDEVAVVDPAIAWAKLRTLQDGARLASEQLGLIAPGSRI